jgi:hypothetical protein
VTYRFRAELWRHQGESPWHFITLPFDQADDIDERTAATRRGFGSVRVTVTIGDTTWATSLFPDTKAKSYVLPIKKQVRAAEQLQAGDTVGVTIDLADE